MYKRQGLGWQELQQKLTDEVATAKVFFNVATLEYLQKGGRIGLVTSILGNALKLNPIVRLLYTSYAADDCVRVSLRGAAVVRHDRSRRQKEQQYVCSSVVM
ncbi:DegV family protein [Escherichia coli]|uniref:DegV family protein n=1 Tax=Escherichia coli TaxID=562 RepID=UPI00338DC8A0